MTTALCIALGFLIGYALVATALLAEANRAKGELQTTIRTVQENRRKDAARRQADVDALEALNETLRQESDLSRRQIEHLQAEGRDLIARLDEMGPAMRRLAADNDRLIDQNRQLDAENKKLMSRIMAADTHAAEARRALAGAESHDVILDLINEPQEKLS